jgi:sugar lactone lactonase YvrE
VTFETLATGLTFPEAPRWHDGALWFSDMHSHAVLRLDPAGAMTTMAEVPGCPSGLGFLPDGRMLVVSMHDRRVLRLDPDGLREHADLSALAPWHCNDMAVGPDGFAYVGNFGDDSAPPAPPKPTVLIAVAPDGQARVVADQLMFPNGIIVVDGGQTLIVAETRSVPGRLTAFRILPDGSLTGRRVLTEFGGGELPDGIAVDADGGIWVAMPFSGQVVRVSTDGAVTRRLDVESPYAVAVGGPDGGDLFVCTAPSWIPEEATRLRGGSVRRTRILPRSRSGLDRHRGGDRPQHLALRDRGPAQFLDDQPVNEGQHAVADTDQILDVGGADHEPGAGQRVPAHQVVDGAPGPDVNPAGRVLHEHDPRFQPEPLGHQDLLLVAAAEQAVQPVRVRWPDIQPLDPLPGRRPLARLVDPSRLGEIRYPAERDVLAHREAGDRRAGMAVGQYQGDSELPRQLGGHRVSVHSLAADGEAHDARNRPAHGTGQQLAPGTGQPGDTEHFAPADLEADASERRITQVTDLKDVLHTPGRWFGRSTGHP